MKLAMAEPLRNGVDFVSDIRFYSQRDSWNSEEDGRSSHTDTGNSRYSDAEDTSFHDKNDIASNDTAVSLISNNNVPSVTRKVHDDIEDTHQDNREDESGVPIDRGWAWVVVGACFGMHVLVLGGVKSFGVLFVELRDKYHVTASELGVVQGVALTMLLGLGLAANMLAVRFTCQKVVFIGGILSSLGFVLSAYIPQFDLIYLTYSIITGLGFGLSYSPCVVMVGLHFKKRRSLANGISLSGSGVGSFILPIIIRWMLNEYGLGGCLLLLGGLMLNVCVFALLFRPFSSYPRKMYIEKVHQKGGQEQDKNFHHLIDESTGNQKQILFIESQVKDRLLQEHFTNDRQRIKDELCSNEHSQFSSCEYIPIASLQSIQKEEFQKAASSLFSKLKCSKCKNNNNNSDNKNTTKLFNWSLLSNPLFLIYALSCVLGNFAYPNIFLMLPAHAESIGQDRDSAALLVSIIGIADLIGRLFFGWFSDLRLMPKRYGFVGCIAISAILNLLVPALKSFPALVTYATLYGLFAGSYMALISVMLAEALGVEKLSSAYGLVNLLMSFGLLPGPLICGAIRDATLKWDYSFILCGILALVGSLPPLFEPCAKRYVDSREKRKARMST